MIGLVDMLRWVAWMWFIAFSIVAIAAEKVDAYTWQEFATYCVFIFVSAMFLIITKEYVK